MTKLYARRGFEWAEDGLVGLWSPVSTGATQSILLDCNPSTSNHGTLTNFSNLNSAWVGSQNGTVLDFDGSNNFVLLGNPSVVTTGRPFFVSAWFRTSMNANQSILAKSVAGSAAHRFWFTTETGFVTVNGTSGTSGVAATFSTNYTDGNWHCLAALYQGTVMSLFYDGALRSSATITQLEPSAHTLIFGKYNDASGGSTGTIAQFNGRIAEVVMFNSILTNSNVLELYRLGPGGAWQDRPRRMRSYFAQITTIKKYLFRTQQQRILGGGLR